MFFLKVRIAQAIAISVLPAQEHFFRSLQSDKVVIAQLAPRTEGHCKHRYCHF